MPPLCKYWTEEASPLAKRIRHIGYRGIYGRSAQGMGNTGDKRFGFFFNYSKYIGVIHIFIYNIITILTVFKGTSQGCKAPSPRCAAATTLRLQNLFITPSRNPGTSNSPSPTPPALGKFQSTFLVLTDKF